MLASRFKEGDPALCPHEERPEEFESLETLERLAPRCYSVGGQLTAEVEVKAFDIRAEIGHGEIGLVNQSCTSVSTASSRAERWAYECNRTWPSLCAHLSRIIAPFPDSCDRSATCRAKSSESTHKRLLLDMILQTLSMLIPPMSPNCSTSSMYLPINCKQISKAVRQMDTTCLNAHVPQRQGTPPLFIVHDLRPVLLLWRSLCFRVSLGLGERINAKSVAAVDTEPCRWLRGMFFRICSLSSRRQDRWGMCIISAYHCELLGTLATFHELPDRL